MSPRSATKLAGKTMVTATTGETASSRTLLWANLATLVAVIASSFGVIQSTHACRDLYASLQVLEARQWHLQEEYGRLLLEESAWASHHRVEKVARSELQMAEPDLANYHLVMP